MVQWTVCWTIFFFFGRVCSNDLSQAVTDQLSFRTKETTTVMLPIRKTHAAFATLALLGLAVPQIAHAQTVLFSDNFGTTPQTDVINGLSDPGRLAGTLYDPSTFTYVNNPGDTEGYIVTSGDTEINGGTLLIGTSGTNANAGYASPSINFTTAPDTTISFDMLSNNTTTGDWEGLFFGSSTNANLVHSNVNKVNGFGLIFKNNGTFQFFDNTVQTTSFTQSISTTNWGTAGTLHNVSVNLMTGDYSGNTAQTVTVSLDGSATPLFTYVRNAGDVAGKGITGNYLGLTTSNTGTAGELWGFDNFSVTTPAPEPSAVAGMFIGVLGLGGLALYARRRGAASH